MKIFNPVTIHAVFPTTGINIEQFWCLSFSAWISEVLGSTGSVMCTLDAPGQANITLSGFPWQNKPSGTMQAKHRIAAATVVVAILVALAALVVVVVSVLIAVVVVIVPVAQVMAVKMPVLWY